MFAHTALRQRCARWLFATGLFLLLGACVEKPSTLERVKEDGVLRVITRNSPATYFQTATAKPASSTSWSSISPRISA